MPQKLLYFLVSSISTFVIPFVAVVYVHHVAVVQNLDGKVNAKNGDSLDDRTVIWCL